MKIYRELNLLEDKKVIKKMNIAALILMAICYGVLLLPPFNQNIFQSSPFPVELGAIVISFLAIIVIHEGIHGIFFKIFNLKGKVKFGFKNGMAYATSPGTMYAKWEFFIISCAPFVILTAVLLIIMDNWPYTWLRLLIAAHGGACAGDFYWCYLLITTPKNLLVEDTEVGLTFHKVG
ncbi:transcriptional regulator [Enterococcus saigonensis]|uniref:Transcriptional regulator n=1 Tax=Enterococcus saigonensis TaxID=1805431 RepID=A0A679ILH7_9ENTE|nr:DUF3267 domain-containing protein [Enterococcus saigonensis]BCA86126.1 transcriptional regulator [Enterococcus saigonensis]